jgi:hypothetical protein
VGAKPAELSVQLSAKFELVVNLKAVKELGLTIPEPFLQRAGDRIALVFAALLCRLLAHSGGRRMSALTALLGAKQT